MKTLLLIRHTKSNWANTTLSDIERPLKPSRKEDGKKMVKFISEKNILPEIIVSSPAKRTLDTAKIFCKKFNINENEIKIEPKLYESNKETILKVIQCIDNTNSVLAIFGHNPSITDVANIFISTKIENIPTTGVVCITFKTNDWKDIKIANALLVFFAYPKLFA